MDHGLSAGPEGKEHTMAHILVPLVSPLPKQHGPIFSDFGNAPW